MTERPVPDPGPPPALRQPIPGSLQASLPDAFRPTVSLVADLDANGRFGATWVGASETRVLAVGVSEGAVDLALADISEVRVEELFGASRLVVVAEGRDRVLATYSRNLVGEFALFSRALDDFRDGRPLLFPDAVERATCPRCGAPLPERGATCPRCLSRTGVLKRILSVLEPYRLRVLLLILCATASVGASMVPPLTYKQIADRVLVGDHPEELGLWVGLMPTIPRSSASGWA